MLDASSIGALRAKEIIDYINPVTKVNVVQDDLLLGLTYFLAFFPGTEGIGKQLSIGAAVRFSFLI